MEGHTAHRRTSKIAKGLVVGEKQGFPKLEQLQKTGHQPVGKSARHLGITPGGQWQQMKPDRSWLVGTQRVLYTILYTFKSLKSPIIKSLFKKKVY